MVIDWDELHRTVLRAAATDPREEKTDEPEETSPWKALMQRRAMRKEQQRTTNEASAARIEEQRLARLEHLERQRVLHERMEAIARMQQGQQQPVIPPVPVQPVRRPIPTRVQPRQAPPRPSGFERTAAMMISGNFSRSRKRKR